MTPKLARLAHGAVFLEVLALPACGPDKDAAPSKMLDEVWCDIRAVPCLITDQDSNGLPTSCSVAGTSVTPASMPGGDRTCFDAASRTPEAACDALCDPATQYLSATLFPNQAECSATVNSDPSYHPDLNSRGFRANECRGFVPWFTPNGAIQSNTLGGAATHTVTVHGDGTATYAGATQAIRISSGLLGIIAPRTACTTFDSTCIAQVNLVELRFEDFAVGDLSFRHLRLVSDGSVLTPSGAFQLYSADPASAAAVPLFDFGLPPQVFDAVGTVRTPEGEVSGMEMDSTSELPGVIQLATGQIGLDVQVSRSINGQLLTLQATVTTATVVDVPPVLTAPASVSIDAGANCSAIVPLSASAHSPVGLPIRLDYVVDNQLVTGDDAGASPALAVGLHTVTIVATDALGATAQASQSLTVNSTASCL